MKVYGPIIERQTVTARNEKKEERSWNSQRTEQKIKFYPSREPYRKLEKSQKICQNKHTDWENYIKKTDSSENRPSEFGNRKMQNVNVACLAHNLVDRDVKMQTVVFDTGLRATL